MQGVNGIGHRLPGLSMNVSCPAFVHFVSLAGVSFYRTGYRSGRMTFSNIA
ncbi:hypothetical protein [Ensifer aridi]|uniref:hypothetical protein n=1 Tax=Ensifer aridi TaxID=1708715 RepID=UPI001557FCB4|nr:hypothetical protein [Ensifer aridi]